MEQEFKFHLTRTGHALQEKRGNKIAKFIGEFLFNYGKSSAVIQKDSRTGHIIAISRKGEANPKAIRR